MKVACIIPARMGSSRYPGKPIANIGGHPMLEHVYRRLKTGKYVNEIVIATCDREIQEVGEGFGARVIMTRDTHVRGTDRVAEAAQKVEADIIINVQGDEPLVDPVTLDHAIAFMAKDPGILCVNLVSKMTDWDIFVSKNVVKTVMDQQHRVLYFSRLPVPVQTRDKFEYGFKQIGIYLFKRSFLLQFASWPQTPLEVLESVDMMRILEHGFPIQGFLGQDSISVDTPADLAYAESIILQDPLYRKVFAGDGGGK